MRIDRDDIKTPLMTFTHVPNQIKSLYTETVLTSLGLQNLLKRNSVILDTHGRYESYFALTCRIARELGIKYYPIFVNAALEVRNQRIAVRKNLASQSSRDDRSQEEIDAIYKYLPDRVLRLDTSRGFEEPTEKLMKQVEKIIN